MLVDFANFSGSYSIFEYDNIVEWVIVADKSQCVKVIKEIEAKSNTNFDQEAVDYFSSIKMNDDLFTIIAKRTDNGITISLNTKGSATVAQAQIKEFVGLNLQS